MKAGWSEMRKCSQVTVLGQPNNPPPPHPTTHPLKNKQPHSPHHSHKVQDSVEWSSPPVAFWLTLPPIPPNFQRCVEDWVRFTGRSINLMFKLNWIFATQHTFATHRPHLLLILFQLSMHMLCGILVFPSKKTSPALMWRRRRRVGWLWGAAAPVNSLCLIL